MSLHLSDEDLLLFIDREMPAQRRSPASKHLAECSPCGRRKAALEATLTAFAEVHEESRPTELTGGLAARSSLKARMASLRPHRSALPWFTQPLAYAAMALLVIAGSGWGLRTLLQRGELRREELVIALPRKSLTPGAVRAVRLEEVCAEKGLDNDPPVDPSLEQAVFREYGVADAAKDAYALDYLIAPTLGGTNDIKNLWPQPSSSTWNARVKDQLEDHLHTLVCQRKLDLAKAQSAMADDWIAAYRRYVPANGTVAVAEHAPALGAALRRGTL